MTTKTRLQLTRPKKIPVTEDEIDGKILVTENETNEERTNKNEHLEDKIVGHTVENGRLLYRVHWYRYPSTDDTPNRKKIFKAIS